MHLVAVGSDCRHVTLHVYPRPRSPITLATSEFVSVGSVGGVVVAKPDPVGYLRTDREHRGCKGGFTPHLVHGSVPQQRASSRDLHPERRSRRRPGAGRVLPGGRRTRAAKGSRAGEATVGLSDHRQHLDGAGGRASATLPPARITPRRPRRRAPTAQWYGATFSRRPWMCGTRGRASTPANLVAGGTR
jgi:hypothetical protein